MNSFEQELRKLLTLGVAPELSQISFLGRSCYATLSQGRLARIEFATCNYADHYTALAITILDSNRGAIDSLRLLFADYFKPQKGGFDDQIKPYLWMDHGTVSWYRTPSPAEFKNLAAAAKKYISLFE